MPCIPTSCFLLVLHFSGFFLTPLCPPRIHKPWCRVLSADRQSMIWLRKRRRNGLCDLVTFKVIGAPIRRRERNDRHHRFSAGTTGTMGYPTWYTNNCARRHMNDLFSQPMITFTRYHIEQFFAVRVNVQRVPLARINSYHS